MRVTMDAMGDWKAQLEAAHSDDIDEVAVDDICEYIEAAAARRGVRIDVEVARDLQRTLDILAEHSPKHLVMVAATINSIFAAPPLDS